MTPGDRIKALREARTLTQAALAQMVGVAVGQVSKWERDEALPSFKKLQALQRALGVSYEDIMGTP